MTTVDDPASVRVPARHLDHQLTGRFEVRLDGRPVDLGTPKQRAVLAVLLLEANRVVSIDRLLDLLWPDGGASTSSLQSYVSNLRRVLEPDRRPRQPATVLITEPPGYRLAVEPVSIDVARFEASTSEADALQRGGDLQGARAALERAFASWSGPLLPELADEPFVIAAASRLERTRVTALGLAAQIHLDLGEAARAVTLLEGPVAEHPLDERLHGLVALGLYRIGRQADALRMIDRARRCLADVAGLDIGPELRELEQRLLAHDPALDRRPVDDTTPPAGATAPAPAASPPERSANVTGHGSAPLVGRVAELAALTEALDDARAGTGRIAVVLGDAGIGKTRLVEELLTIAQGSGVVTARTRCPEDGAIPAFRPAVDLAEQVRRTGAVAAGIVPPTETGAASLFRLYENVEQGLRSAAAPLLVVVDDLQWADADTLRLLAHVAGGLHLAPVLLAVTVRTSHEHPSALLDCLTAFARAPGSVHVALDGLDRSDVSTWLHQHDTEVTPEVIEVVHERTGGHPLFLKELGDLLRSEGGLADADAARSVRSIPPAVQFVVRRRVARLPVATQQLLGVAAVVGRNFELDVVADVADRPLDEALDQIVPALGSGMVVDDGERGFRFSHALVAEALVAEMNAARRARIHARTARAIADRAGPGFGHRAEIVAHHAFLGRFAGASELAATAAAEAARRASAGFGYEESAAQWERSLIAQRAVLPVDRHVELHALRELAASRFRADLVAPAKAAAIEAMTLAEAMRDHTAMVGAAALVGHPHLWPNQGYGEIDRAVVAALRRVLGALDPDDDRARALVLGALAVELTYADPSEVGPIQVEAEDAARRGGDPSVLARVLVNVAGPLRPTELERRRELAREVIELGARGLAADEVTLVGWFHLAVAEWDAADFDTAIDHLRTTRRIAERIGGGTVRAQLGWYEAATAIARGRYDDARRICDAADHLYRRTRRFNADVIGLVPHVAMACDLGGGDEVFDRLAHLTDGSTFDRLSSIVAAWHLVESGCLEAARDMVASGVDLASPLPDDFTFLCGTTLALHVAVALGDATTIAALAERLTPYTGRWTQAGSGPIAAGLVDLALARAAAALGDGVRARTLFDRAVAGHERLRTPAWLARSLRDQAAFLLGTGDADDRSIAVSVLARARTIAVENDLIPVVGSIDRLAPAR